MKIGIIGLGNMGFAFVSGLSEQAAWAVSVFDHNDEKLSCVTAGFPNVSSRPSAADLIRDMDVVMVCVRATQLDSFLREHRTCFADGQVLVFIQAGIAIDSLKAMLNRQAVPVVRAIPNINVAARCGHTIVLRTENPSVDLVIHDLFSFTGKVTAATTETQLEQWSLLTGCTPALVAVFLEAILESSEKLGVPPALARELVLGTCSETLRNLIRHPIPLDGFISQVCTTGGNLEACTDKLRNSTNFNRIVQEWYDNITKI